MSANPLCASSAGRFVPFIRSKRTSQTCSSDLRILRLRSRSAFSLIEMVVVIGIIAILAVLGISAFSNTSQGMAVSTSAAQVSSMMSAARQLAVSSNRKTRFYVLLDEEPNKPEWRLRGYGILQQELGIDEKNEEAFRPATSLNLLREGVFFARDIPEATEESAEPASEKQMLEREPTMMSFQNVKGVRYAYIEFLPTGGTESPSASNIVRIERGLAPGVPVPNQTNYARVGVAKNTGRVKVERPEA